jgi:sigma-B regulation protein RsbU (phosphoserine phosphatase)
MRKTGQVHYLDCSGDLVVGIMEGTPYSSRRLFLDAGDRVFLYTDGVTEAMNASDEIFSNERLLEVLSGCAERSVFEIAECVGDAVNAFCQETPQYDDITVMTVLYNGNR